MQTVVANSQFAPKRSPEAPEQVAPLTAPFRQPRELLTGLEARPLKKGQHHGLVGALQADITKAPHNAGDKVVARLGREPGYHYTSSGLDAKLHGSAGHARRAGKPTTSRR